MSPARWAHLQHNYLLSCHVLLYVMSVCLSSKQYITTTIAATSRPKDKVSINMIKWLWVVSTVGWSGHSWTSLPDLITHATHPLTLCLLSTLYAHHHMPLSVLFMWCPMTALVFIIVENVHIDLHNLNLWRNMKTKKKDFFTKVKMTCLQEHIAVLFGWGLG